MATTKTFSLPEQVLDMLDDFALTAGHGSRSAAVVAGLHAFWMTGPNAAIHRFAIAAAAAYGPHAAVAVNPARQVIVGTPTFNGPTHALGDDGGYRFNEGAWNFADGPWLTVGPDGYERWSLSVVSTPDASDPLVTTSVLLFDDVPSTALGHVPCLHWRTGSHDNPENVPPVAVARLADRSVMASLDGRPVDFPLPKEG